MIVITIHDTVGGTWSNPVTAQNEASAKRDFVTACADTDSLLGQHPADFQLFAIGEWLPSLDDVNLPIFRSFESPKFLCAGVPNEQQK